MMYFIRMLLILMLCLPAVVVCATTLPMILWDPDSPVLHRDYWSEALGVVKFQNLVFLCPNNKLSTAPIETTSPKVHYNLYVREVQGKNLDYDTVCNTKDSASVYSCNQTYNDIDYRKLSINTVQSDPNDPTFKVGKDYIFFSTSNGRRDSLKTPWTKCTMVFRIHFCGNEEKCPVPLCSTFGRYKGCTHKSKYSNEPRDIHVTNSSSSSLNLFWKPPLNTDNAVAHYSVSYWANTSDTYQTKIVDSYSNSTILTNLNASTEYYIRVRAVTCSGPGNFSKKISNSTKDEAITSAPTNVTLTGRTTSSLAIKWEKPDVIGSNLIYYSLCVRETQKSQNKDCHTTIVLPSQQSAVIYGLKADTSYTISVRGENLKGPGRYSEELRVNTQGIPLQTTYLPTTEPATSDKQTTTKVLPPSPQPQRSCSGATVDSLSIIIGIVIGAIAAVGVVAMIWLLKAKRQKGMSYQPPIKNSFNSGYRASVSDANTIDKKRDINGHFSIAMNHVAKK